MQRHTTQNQFSAFGLRYEHYIRCYWQVCSTGSSPVPLLRTALTLFVPTSWDGCIRQILDSKVVVRVKRWPTRKKSLLILLSWLVKQRFPLGPVPAALSQLVPVGVVDCRGDHLWRTVDRSLPRLTGAFLRAWLRLRHVAFWGCAPAPLTKLDLIDWLIIRSKYYSYGHLSEGQYCSYGHCQKASTTAMGTVRRQELHL